MKIGIIGAGAMGSLLAFYLSPKAEVWLLDPWQAQVEAISTVGLQCEREGVVELRRPHATSDPAMIGPCDRVLVLVKAHQTRWAAEQARLLLGGQDEQGPPALRTQVVTLQNGVGNREMLAEVLGAEQVGQGVTSLGATMLGPGRVRHAGQGVTVFGALPDRAAMTALVELFRACGLPAELSDDLDTLIWDKLVVNVGINALTALLRVPNGVLVSVPEARTIVAQAVAEAVAVAAARGTPLRREDPLVRVFSVAEATGANRSSMLQDVLRGSPSEIATINGAVVREGARLGVPTPVNSLLTALVQALDATAGARIAEH